MRICTDLNCHMKGKPQPIENFYLKKSGSREGKCNTCRKADLLRRYHERKAREPRQPKPEPIPKQKNKFTEGAKQALGYYELY